MLMLSHGSIKANINPCHIYGQEEILTQRQKKRKMVFYGIAVPDFFYDCSDFPLALEKGTHLCLKLNG